MKVNTNLTTIFTKYKGLWVALAKDEMTVLSSAKTLKETLAKALKKGFKEPIVMRVPQNLKTFIGGI